MDFDWKKTLSTIAPGLATMLGGPLAGTATTALISFFGLDTKAPNIETQIQDAIQAMTPAQMIELKKVENELIIELKKADIDVFKAEVEDRSSARTSHKDNLTPAILTYLLIICAGSIIYFVFTSQMDGIDKTLVGAVVGYVFGELKQATGYWLGSSFGSSQKNAVIETALNK
jgi:hypothetical protein